MNLLNKFFKNWDIWKKRISAAMACIVVFVTVYAMVLPAITLDQDAADDDDGIFMDEEGDAWDDDVWPLTLTWSPGLEKEKGEETASFEDGMFSEEETAWDEKAAETAEEQGCFVTATVYEYSGLPADVQLQVEEIKKGSPEYETYLQNALAAVSSEDGSVTTGISYARFFDIAFFYNGEEIEPSGPVSVVIDYKEENHEETEAAGDAEAAKGTAESLPAPEDISVVHFDQENQEASVLTDIVTGEKEEDLKSVSFDAGQFSVYGVVGTYTVEVTGETDSGEEHLEFSSSYSLKGGESILLSDLLKEAWPEHEALQIGYVTGVTAENTDAAMDTAEGSEDRKILNVIHDEGSGDYQIEAAIESEEDLGGRKADLTVYFEGGSEAVFRFTISGTPAVDAGLALISSADGIYLPDTAEGSAEELAAEDISADAEDAADTQDQKIVSRVFDISLNLTEEEQASYEGGFLVDLTLPEEVTGKDFHLYHIHDGRKEELSIEKTGNPVEGTGLETVSGIQFVTPGFSEFVLQYTVDFVWEVNGKTYQFSMPGGGFASFASFAKVMGIAESNLAAFLADVEKVEFSDPSLVWVGKVENAATVGTLKNANSLEVLNSVDLTKNQIEEINAQTVEAGDWAFISLRPFDTEESLTVTMKNGEVFTAKVTDDQIGTHFISNKGKLYEITVTYGADAQIPAGSRLRVTEFEEGTDEYNKVRNAVIADKQARGEVLDFTDLAALDISIIDPSGNEIEPSAPVTVQMSIKELPGVEDLRSIAGSLKVKHHVETENGVVVETVYEGSTAAEFVMETDETVAAAGVAVDPAKADLNAKGFSSTDFYEDGRVVMNAAELQDEIDVTFQTPVFSSFTVQWSGAGNVNPMASINWSNGLPYLAYIPYAQVNVHYVNQDGMEISRPSSVNDINLADLTTANYSYNIANTFGKPIDGFIYQGAHFGSYTGEPVTDLTLSGYMGFGWNGNVIFYNNSAEVSRMAANGAPYVLSVPTSDIYLVYNGTSSLPHATVHYVDQEGNELTVINGTPVSDTTPVSYYDRWGFLQHTYNYNYLIYDIDGYEYAYTYRNTDNESNRITPALNFYQNRWKYTTGTDENGNNRWTDLSDGDDIYVVYKKRTTPPAGGTPKPDPESEDLDPATITKSSKVNGDGTNTLSLSVTGHTKELETQKMADVIVIYDVSGSMQYVMDAEREAWGLEKTRMDEAETATKALAHTLLSEKNTPENPDLIRMALVSFSNTAQVVQGFTNDESTFTRAVDRLPNPNGGTNWEYALQIANEMSVASDRATFVIFVTDGNPTFRLARQILNNGGSNGLGANDVIDYYFRYRVFGHGDSDDWGRNYAGALAQVKAIVNSNKHFYTVGIGPASGISNLTNLLNDSSVPSDHGYTATNSQQLTNAFKDIAARIIGTLGHSSISISDGITELTQIVRKTNLVSDAAFAEDDFTYWKGKVDHLATQEDVTAGRAQKVGDPVVLEADWGSWDPASENCEPAKYEDGAVVWNMGDRFMPKEGYTYQVRFKVWPSQEAYDLLAGLNNGIYVKDDTAKVIRNSDGEEVYGTDYYNQISGAYPSYQLKTNDDTSYSYKEATLIDGIVTPIPESGGSGSFDDVDPLHLTTSPLKVQKQFEYNYVDSKKPEDSVTLELYSKTDAGEWADTFKTITLDAVYQTDGSGNYVDAEGRVLHESDGKYYDEDEVERERVLLENESWYSENNFVSYGLVTYDEDDPNGTSKVYETGHDFTLREIGINAHYYELEAGTYRPMYINGTATILEQVAKPVNMGENVFHFQEGGKSYYKLDGKYYVDTGSDVIMSALNKHRSYLDLTKRVEGDAAANEKFEYQITFTVPENIDNYDTVEQYIWFSVYNPSDRRTLSPSEYDYTDAMTADALDEILDSTQYSGPEYENYLVATSGQTFTLKIKENWNVRFLNLPIGTTYAIEEIHIPAGYEFVSAAVSGTVWPAGSATGPATAIDAATLPVNDGTFIGGTINLANARYRTLYTNRTVTQSINILKTRQDGSTPLEGAEFTLYTKDGYEADPKISSRSGLTSNAAGIIQLGELAPGEYRLVETKAPVGFILLTEPIEITVNADKTVTYSQPGHNIGMSNRGISGNVTNGYQLVVINNEGASLPSTGGPGTGMLYLFGFILTGLAGVGLVMKQKRRSAA